MRHIAQEHQAEKLERLQHAYVGQTVQRNGSTSTAEVAGVRSVPFRGEWEYYVGLPYGAHPTEVHFTWVPADEWSLVR